MALFVIGSKRHVITFVGILLLYLHKKIQIDIRKIEGCETFGAKLLHFLTQTQKLDIFDSGTQSIGDRSLV